MARSPFTGRRAPGRNSQRSAENSTSSRSRDSSVIMTPASSPICIDSDDEDDRSPGFDRNNAILLDDEDDLLEVDATPETVQTLHSCWASANNATLSSAKTRLDEVIKPGQTVELCDGSFLRIVYLTQGHGMSRCVKVVGIYLQRNRHIDKKIDKHGYELYSWLPKGKNELCAVLQITSGRDKPKLGSSLKTCALEEVRAVRNVVFTNKPWDDSVFSRQKDPYRCLEHRGRHLSPEDRSCAKCAENMESNGPLHCRWKYVEELDTARNKIVAWQLRQLEPEECSPGHNMHPIAKMVGLRGLDYHANTRSPAVQPFAGCSPTGRGSQSIVNDRAGEPAKGRKRAKPLTEAIVDLTLSDSEFELTTETNRCRKSTETVTRRNPDNGLTESYVYEAREALHKTSEVRKIKQNAAYVPFNRPARKRYTYTDICAGAGGSARGAKIAGLDLKCLLDNMPQACESLRLNFRDEIVCEMDMRDFCLTNGDRRIDVMHVSFPCQAHSTLNRRQNPELDASRVVAAYGTFEQLLKICKPRIVTMEQVLGIMQHDEGQHLRAQIHALTKSGYDVRWKSHNLLHYGNVQARHRLITIAACPGQILPDWPEHTHGPSRRRFTTIQDILNQVPRPGYNQAIMEHAIPRDPRDRPPYNPHTQLKGCIDSGGGYRPDKGSNNYHPSGRRDFSYQEKAQLQGFPWYHRFFGGITSVAVQIANAVPPVFAEQLFRTCIKALEKTDSAVEDYNKPVELD